MMRYLNWLRVKTAVFNVGSYRRERLGAKQSADFFDPENSDGSSARMHMAVAALDDMVNYLDSGGRVAIYDATNSTTQRQKLIASRCKQEGFDLLWVESICDNDEIIEVNIRATKLNSPDYVGVDPDAAATDFRNRIKMYKKTYATMSDDQASFVKLIDSGRQMISNNIRSYLQSKIVFFLSNLHTAPRYIWLSRHGESEFNKQGRIGGDSNLSDAGNEYSRKLADWVMEQQSEIAKPVIVWTSTLKRTVETAQYIPTSKVHLRALDEIDAGECDGLTYQEVEIQMPEEYRLRQFDKLNYRYPRGESYNDVIARLEPIIFELERTKGPILIIAHQAIQRCLYAYLMDREPAEVPFIPVKKKKLFFFFINFFFFAPLRFPSIKLFSCSRMHMGLMRPVSKL
jgi:broad specificity phosphatase PhoE